MTFEPLTPSAADRLNESKIGWLTTLRGDGSPHTTPVWFVSVSGFLWIVSGIRTVKVRNIDKDPRVSFAIDGTADRPLVAQADVALVTLGETSAVVAEAFARKYDGWDIGDTSVDGERVVLQIRIERWLLAG